MFGRQMLRSKFLDQFLCFRDVINGNKIACYLIGIGTIADLYPPIQQKSSVSRHTHTWCGHPARMNTA